MLSCLQGCHCISRRACFQHLYSAGRWVGWNGGTTLRRQSSSSSCCDVLTVYSQLSRRQQKQVEPQRRGRAVIPVDCYLSNLNELDCLLQVCCVLRGGGVCHVYLVTFFKCWIALFANHQVACNRMRLKNVNITLMIPLGITDSTCI